MKDRLIGLDINGWHDRAVRNWRLDRDGLEQAVPEGHLIDGGAVSRVVRVGDEVLTAVGGPRAQLAMHGRGAGWGDFGDEDRRVLIRRSDDPMAWGACMQELGREARIAVLAIPDLPHMTEEAREKRLEAMQALRARRTMLVWSSVALALQQCQQMTVEDGQKLGIIEIDTNGLRLQTLDIVERDALLTPRRRSGGYLVETSLGLAERERICLEKVSADANDPRVARALGLADLPTLLAMSAPGATNSELIRLENGDWVEAVGRAPGIQDAPNLGAFFDAADHILLHGPCQPELLDAIRALLQRASSKKIDVAHPSAVAYGAFLVAMRVRQGLPPWYDYLPDVETIVQDREEAESLSLVGEDEAAEAGKTWRSRKPITLRWPAGSISMKVWLKKDDDPDPRMSPATVPAAPERDEKVQLYLEQQPAQGRAKLRITSETWPFLQERPAIVDWDAGERDPDGRDWETIISDFKVRPPVIPERVILPAHTDLWYPEQGDGLAGALRAFDGKNYTPVYKALSARRRVYLDQPNHPDHDRVFYAVDSDGGRPSGVKDEDWDLLLEIISQAEVDFTTSNAKNNHALGVLSWSFRLCPATVWPIVVRVLRKDGGPPSFPGWRIMYPQALGRTAADRDAFTAAIDYLNSLGVDWTKDQQACAAFLLSRNDEIFEILDPATIDRWARVAQASLKQGLRKGFGNNQHYLPILIAGLLRWRFREPNAFAPIHDTKGEVFADLLERAIHRDDIYQRQRAAYQTVLDAISDTGARPDLLQTLFDLL